MFDMAELNGTIEEMTWLVSSENSDDEIAWEDYFAETSAK